MKRTHTPQDVEKIQNRWRKVSIRTVENTIGLARNVANGTTKFPFLGYCADIMEKMLEEIKMLRQQADYIKHLEEGLESSINLNKAQAERQEK
jgi:hypothetical protein